MSIDFDSFEEPVTKVFHKSEVSLGSDEGNDIVLDRSEISRNHAKILCRINGNGNTPSLYITDLGSTNGTLVERDSIRPGVEVPLKNHQRVVIGSYLIKPILVPDSEKAQEPDAKVESRPELFKESMPVVAAASDPTAGSIAGLAAQKKTPEAAAPMEPTSPIVSPPPRDSISPMVSTPPPPAEPIFAKEREIAQESELKAQSPARPHKPTEESAQHRQELERLEKVSAPVRPSQAKAVLHVPSAIRIRLDGGNIEGVKIVAKKLITFRGVIHCAGAAVPGVKINAGKYGETMSGPDGGFQVKGIVEGESLSLSFVYEGYRFRDFHGPVVNDTPVTIVATKVYTLRGEIKHKGVGLGGALVDAGPVGKTLTGPDGLFEFKAIAEGTDFAVSVSKDRFQITGPVMKGTVDRNIDLKFTARELFTISGFVIHNGTALAGVEVECINFGKTLTDAEGKYIFENVPEGEEYAIVAHKEGFAFEGE
jgi:pSer/pThr/pTyr-binding forkhead associated (FHA) protein